MKKNNGIIIFDLDMYSNRISFFSNNRERIGSWFGLFLTLIYILSSLIILTIYSLETIKRKEIRVYDSDVITEGIPSIEINSNDLNLAFSLEDPLSSNRYIDPSIYYPEVNYIDRIKNEEGDFNTVIKKKLKYSICKNDSFGKNYIKAFGNIKLNNSYCFEDFNLTLTGGYKFDRMSYISIKIIPCLNKTDEFLCKPKEIIDQYLEKGYFSIFIKDFGLNPVNYNIPILPTIQNIYTTISNKFYRDVILNFRITEIQTDTGLFFEKINKKKYLKFNNEKQSFYFRSEEEYNEGKQICTIQIRLDDHIHVQKRTYQKIPEIFSLIGGYMQLLSTIFSLISILTNLDLEVKILNNLFDFNLKQNRMTIKINNLKDFNYDKHINNKHYHYTSKKTLIFQKIKIKSNKNLIYNRNNNSSIHSFTKNNLISNDNNNQNRNILPIININKFNNIEENGENSQIIINNNNNIYFDNNNNNNNNKKSLFHNQCHNNNNNVNIINDNKDNNNNDIKLRTHSLKRDEKIYFRPIRMFTNSLKKGKNNEENNNNDKDKNIHLNLINYYCCRNISKMKKPIELFDLGVSLYRKRMDIINVFTILLLSEKIMLKIERQKNFTLKESDEFSSSIVNKQ